MAPFPAQLLGLPVLDAAGAPVGVVADVGLAGWELPKFLLVRAPGGAALLRVELEEVAEMGQASVRLARGWPGPKSFA